MSKGRRAQCAARAQSKGLLSLSARPPRVPRRESSNGFAWISLCWSRVGRGAARVDAVDGGRGQLDAALRGDPRVVVMERTHARALTPADFQERPELVTVDLSFISFTKILPVLPPLLAGSGEILALLKPQFEVGKGEVGKGGVVRDPEQHRRVIATVGRLAVLLYSRTV